MSFNPSDDTDTGDASATPTPAQAAARARREREALLEEAERAALATPHVPRLGAAKSKPMAPPPAQKSGERIAKALARAGLCSRREAERWIEDGRISVNGVTLDSPAFNVTAQDKIAVDGRSIAGPQPTRLWRYHKPQGLVTTHADPQGRETVFEHLPENLPRVISVGRLDLSSEGLLLLTNDGGLARALELPATGWLRRYRVRAYGRVTQTELSQLADGIVVDGISYGPMEAVLDRAETSNAWLTVSIREGKNREVRRVLEAIGLKVNRLIRVSYGPFQLGKMPPGSVDEVSPSAMREMLGPLLPAEPERLSVAPVRPHRSAPIEAPAAKTARPGQKPKPKSAKTRVSLLEEEAARRNASKTQARAGLSKTRAQSSTKTTRPKR